MSVPLDKMYEFLQNTCNNDVLIYRYFPHGERKIEHCRPIHNPSTLSMLEKFSKMHVFCHDQEPLNLDFFPGVVMQQIPDLPFNVFRMASLNMLNKYDKIILIHSEINSAQVKWFEETGAIPVYWFSHALIAIDWFRYAQHDSILQRPKKIAKDFLIYNRAWQGSREYRLKFTEEILNHDLASHCKMSFNAVDGYHYSQHQFQNMHFALSRFDLEKKLPVNTYSSTASADYYSDDYLTTGIEIVLETLFDDKRWHLTEKTFRPIACGHPFIILGPPGSLQYLRNYGFKTFDGWIDESYDAIVDSRDRLNKIVSVMKNIATMPLMNRNRLYQHMRTVAQFNKQHFFSQDFFKMIVKEFETNFVKASAIMQQYSSGAYFKMFLQKMQKEHGRWSLPKDELQSMMKIVDSN